MWSQNQQVRLAIEKKILNRELPQFQFYNPTHDTYVSGWQGTNGGYQCYQLKLLLPPRYPDSMPELYVTYPGFLWKYRATGTVNAEGASHAFHTRPNGLNGCVQICHSSHWHSAITCVAVFLKGIAWLQAYENHLRTGKDLARFLL